MTARLIEVKGSGTTIWPQLLDRQRDAALALGADWWLYVAFNCRSEPQLFVVEEPRRLPMKRSKLPNPAELPEWRRARRLSEEGTWTIDPADIMSLGSEVGIAEDR